MMDTRIDHAMLIDDDEIDQRYYQRTLKRSGLVENIHAFTMATEALDFLLQKKQRMDVIFLDINMPRMTGFEFLERATEELGDRFVDVVIIMLTTSIDPNDRDRAQTYDVVREFLNKPLTIEHVKHVAQLLKEARG